MSLDLVVIYPNNRKKGFGALANDIAAITPPLQCGLLYRYIQMHGYNVNLIDAEILNLSANEVAQQLSQKPPRLVCISSDYLNSGDVTKISAAIALSAAIKDLTPSLPVVLEGIVPTVYPECVLKESKADFVLRGEAYAGLLGLIRILSAGTTNFHDIPGLCFQTVTQVIISDVPPIFPEANTLTVPWEIMPPSSYRAHHWHCFGNLKARTPYASVFTNLGCPYNCNYCVVNALVGKPNFRERPIDSVVKELRFLHHHYNVRNIRIIDNIFTFRPDYVSQLCDHLIADKLNLNMWAYARIETIKDKRSLIKMKKAGINWLAYGIESADETIRGNVAKTTSTTNIEQVLEWTSSAGIHIVGNFMFGLPNDSMDSMRKTLEMAKQYCFEWTNFYCTMAYPGSRLHEDIKSTFEILPKTWSGYGQYSVDSKPLPTRFLSSSDILRFRDAAFTEYYTYSPYRKKILKLFGEEALKYIDQILSVKLERQYEQVKINKLEQGLDKGTLAH